MAAHPPTTTKSRSSSRVSISFRSARRRALCWATSRCLQAMYSSATLACSPITFTKRRPHRTFLRGHISQLNWQPTPRSKLQTRIRRTLPSGFIESPHNLESFGRSNLQRAQAFLQAFLERAADGHRFADAFHLRGECGIGLREFLEGEARNLGDDVINARLEAAGARHLCRFSVRIDEGVGKFPRVLVCVR